MNLKAKSILLILLIILGIMILFSCKTSKRLSEEDIKYIASVEDWHKKRVERLTDKNGWLSLAGLFWLKNGENTFGADTTNDIIFPTGKAPDFIGSIFAKNDVLLVKIKPGVNVFADENIGLLCCVGHTVHQRRGGL